MDKVLALILIGLTAVSAAASLSPELKEWGTGPAQWIMTPEEQRAWRKVSTDEEAVQFIDLFWARRDPSPNSAANEYRSHFDARVLYSDQNFGEKRKRGAMTDRGRVYIVMGPPTTMDGTLGQSHAQMGGSDAASDMSGLGQSGTRYVWVWEREDARQFDVARVEVVFNEEPAMGRVQRNPRYSDFGRAGPLAIRKAIVNPDLSAVPEWAAVGGLQPRGPAPRVVEERTILMPEAPPAPAPAPAESETPAVASGEPGVSRLTLLERGAINARSATDPFAVQSRATFPAGHDVPWAVQFCSDKADLPKLKYMLLMTGQSEQRTREKDAKPEPLTSRPGCYVVQGMVPISKLSAGKYKLTVMIDSATGESYTVTQDFRVQ